MISTILALYLMQTTKNPVHAPPNPCSNPVKCPKSFKPVRNGNTGPGSRK